jgi:hypothetical protein
MRSKTVYTKVATQEKNEIGDKHLRHGRTPLFLLYFGTYYKETGIKPILILKDLIFYHGSGAVSGGSSRKKGGLERAEHGTTPT